LLHQADVVHAHRGRVNADIVALLRHACDITPCSRLWTTPTQRSGGSPRATARARRSTAPAPPSLQASSLLDVASSCMVRHHHGAGSTPPRHSTSTAWHYSGGLRSRRSRSGFKCFFIIDTLIGISIGCINNDFLYRLIITDTKNILFFISYK
jgi:hypothetical protein